LFNLLLLLLLRCSVVWIPVVTVPHLLLLPLPPDVVALFYRSVTHFTLLRVPRSPVTFIPVDFTCRVPVGLLVVWWLVLICGLYLFTICCWLLLLLFRFAFIGRLRCYGALGRLERLRSVVCGDYVVDV